MKKYLFLYIIILIQSFIFSQNLELVGYTDVHPGNFKFDVWGYFNPENGKEYAIVGASSSGIEIIDVTTPQNPQKIFSADTIPGFDMKIWKNYLYCVTGGAGFNSGKILDIADPENPFLVGTFNSAHNIFISEDGLLLAESPGLIIYDLKKDPANPELLWNSETPGGHDAAVIGNRIYDFHGGSGTNIYEYDISNGFSIQWLGIINFPPVIYHHSGWITEDERYLFICDELSNNPNPDITIWDISIIDEPVMVGDYTDPSATVHNLYIIGNYAYTSFYTAGLRIFDVSDPENIKVAAHFDTSPDSGEGFSGAFGVYPFLPSGNILVSDQTGLYIFKFHKTTQAGKETESYVSFKLNQNYPNPFNPSTTITFHLDNNSFITLKVYDVLGQEVVVLMNEVKPAGDYSVEFNIDKLSNNMRKLSSGIFFYELKSDNFISTKKMILLK